jgi:hypothetical protein
VSGIELTGWLATHTNNRTAHRQEAFTIGSIRVKKKEEYKQAKLQKQVEDKQERLKAIRQGFTVLSSMRSSMKDIMDKTNHQLKTEMARLRHKSAFSPDKVVEKAVEVSQQVLFPRCCCSADLFLLLLLLLSSSSWGG